MQAIILCAGRGTRMGEKFRDIPKALIEVKGKTLLSRQLEVLERASISPSQLVLGHKPEMFQDFRLKTAFNSKYTITNMVFSIYCAIKDNLIHDDVLFTYGDIAYNFDIPAAYINCLNESPEYDLYVAVDFHWQIMWGKRMEDIRLDAQTLSLDKETGLIVDIGRTIENNELPEAQFIGTFAVPKHSLSEFRRFLSRGFEHGFPGYDARESLKIFTTDLFQLLIAEGWRLKYISIYGGWIEVDTQQDLNVYQNDKYFTWLSLD